MSKKDEPKLEEINPSQEIADLKVTTKNLNRARLIVENTATITKMEYGHDVDLIAVLGVRHESLKKRKGDAIEEASKLIAKQLDDGSLELADSFESQYGIKKSR
jgi:dephospho-CoA kinase